MRLYSTPVDETTKVHPHGQDTTGTDAMRFIIPINAPEGEDGSVTADIVETNSIHPRTNRRKLTEYFKARGVHTTEMKKVFKAMGFDKKALTGAP
jgi:hypothetical protein